MFCPNCGTQSENVNACPQCGYVFAEEPAAPVNPGFAPVVEAKAPAAKKLPKNKITAAIIAVVVVVAIIIASVAIAGAGKPMVKIASGVEKLLFNTESFKFTIKAYDEKTTGAVAWGDNLVKSSFLVKTEGLEAAATEGDFVVYYEEYYGNGGMEGNLSQLYDYIKQNPEELFENTGMDYDEYVEMMEEEAGITPDKVFGWIDTIVKKEKVNEDTVEEIFDSWVRVMFAEEIDEDVENIPDYKTLKKVLVKFLKNGLNDEAVEVLDKYTEDGIKKYDLKINTKEFAKCLYEFVKENKDLKDFLATDAGEDLLDSLERATDYSADRIKITVGLKSGRLAFIQMGEKNSKITVEFYDFNKKVDFEAEVADIKKKDAEFVDLMEQFSN